MTITVATVGNYNRDLKFPVRKRRDFHIEDDLGNVWHIGGNDVEDLNFDDQAFLDNVLIPHFEHSVREQAIRDDEESKAAIQLDAEKRAVENTEQAIDDAVQTRLKVQVV